MTNTSKRGRKLKTPDWFQSENPVLEVLLSKRKLRVGGKMQTMPLIEALLNVAASKAASGSQRHRKILLAGEKKLSLLRDPPQQPLSSADLAYIEEVQRRAEEYAQKGYDEEDEA